MDFTDLETFGETTTVKTPKVQKMNNEEDARVKSKDATHASSLNKSDKAGEHIANTSSSSLEEINSLGTVDGLVTVERESSVPKTESMQRDSAQKSDQDVTGDSEDEKLVIDVSLSPVPTPTAQLDPTSVSQTDLAHSESSPSEKPPRRTRQSRRSKTDDQLGEILRMQTAMFNSANDRGKCSTASKEMASPTRTPGHSVSVHCHPTSLVKPCVTSYLERNQNQDGETCTAPHTSARVVNNSSTEHRSWCQMHFRCVDLKG